MDEFDIGYELLGKTFTVRVTAENLDAAWKQVENMNVLELLQGKTVKEVGDVFSGSLVRRAKRQYKQKPNKPFREACHE